MRQKKSGRTTDMNLWNKHRSQGRKDIFTYVAIVIALLVIFFIGSAILAIVIGGLPGFWKNIKSREVLFALRLSVTTATVSSIVVMALALPTAYALTRTSMPLKRSCSLLIELTLSLPFILLGLSLLIMFSSPAGKWLKFHGIRVVFAPLGIVMAHLLVNLPYAIRLVKTAFENADTRLEFIAETLGASRFQSFRTILIPGCRSSLISTFILTWSRAMGEFGATLMLVGITRMKTETLPGSIYLNISTGNNEAAMSTAVLILLISGTALFLSQMAARKNLDHGRQVER